VIELRKAGNTRLQILEITKFPDRFIREHMKGVQVTAKPVKRTHLAIAASQAYPLAIRPQGIKDFELRQIAYDVYGTKLDVEKGITTAAYNKDTLNSIKKRVRELAQGEQIDGEQVVPKFVPDWVCDERPQASRVALEAAALELSQRIDDMLSDFLCEFMNDPDSDSLEMTEAQAKQKYAVRRHLLKLAVPEFNLSAEPTATLLARSLAVTDELEATQDLPVVQTPIKYFGASVDPLKAVVDNAANELDAFFDDVAIAEASFTVKATLDISTHDDGMNDPFACVGIASAEQIRYSRGKLDTHIQFLESLLNDDDFCDVYIDTEQDGRYTYGFDITQYIGGKNAQYQKHHAVHPASFDYTQEPF